MNNSFLSSFYINHRVIRIGTIGVVLLLFVLVFSSVAQEKSYTSWDKQLDALKLKKLEAGRNTTASVDASIALAFHFNLNRMPIAIDKAKEGIALAQKLGYRKGNIEGLIALGEAEYLAANFESSHKAFHRIAELVRDTTREYANMAQAYRGMATARFGMASFATANKLINTALEYAILTKDPLILGKTYRSYAFIIGMNSTREEVFAANDSALKYLNIAGDKYAIATVHDNIAIVCTHIPYPLSLNEVKFGIENSKISIKFFEENGYEANLGMAYSTLGLLYCGIDEYEKGYAFLEKGIAQMAKDNNHRNLIAALVGYSKVNFRLNKFQESINLSDRAAQLADTFKIYDLAAFAYNLQSLSYDKLGNIEKAYFYSRKSKEVGQRVFSDSLRSSLVRAEMKYEKLLEAARANVREEEIKKQRKNIFLLSIGIFILLALATVLGFLYIKMRNQGKVLRLQKEEIERKNSLLNESNKTKDKLFSIISHDLRGPLGTYKLATDYLFNLGEEGDLEAIKSISLAMKKSSTSIADMVDNLLVWSQAQSDGFTINPERLRIKDFLEDLKSFHQKIAEAKSIQVHIDVAPNLLLTTDRNCLQVIFRNLLVNALKFTPTEGVIHLFAYRKDIQYIEIGVKDSGVGMDEEQKSLLFTLDKRKSRLGTKGEVSHGLGMMLVKEMADLIGAQLQIDSEINRGTSITLILKEKQVIDTLSGWPIGNSSSVLEG